MLFRSEDIADLCDYNIKTVNEIADKICKVCAEPMCSETLLKRLFDEYGLVMDFQQYVLVGSTVRSYLAYLKDVGRINAYFENNMLLWYTV